MGFCEVFVMKIVVLSDVNWLGDGFLDEVVMFGMDVVVKVCFMWLFVYVWFLK